jgi:hypothetical protein
MDYGMLLFKVVISMSALFTIWSGYVLNKLRAELKSDRDIAEFWFIHLTKCITQPSSYNSFGTEAGRLAKVIRVMFAVYALCGFLVSGVFTYTAVNSII